MRRKTSWRCLEGVGRSAATSAAAPAASLNNVLCLPRQVSSLGSQVIVGIPIPFPRAGTPLARWGERGDLRHETETCHEDPRLETRRGPETRDPRTEPLPRA